MSATVSSPLLVTEGLTRRFGEATAVDRVSMTVGPGEIVGLLGANGAGKTTLIRMMLGLLAPTEGSATMFGSTPSRGARRRLGYVSQSLGLYRDMTVAENVEFQAAAFGADPDGIVLPAEVEAVRDRLVGSIGLGRQRQLAFACALGHRPDLLVLDEPTSGVDPLARARLWDAVRAEVERDVGVLVTTHYMEEAQQCDRLVLMDAGKVAAAGTVAEIIAGRTVVEVTAESWSDAFAALGATGYDVMLAGRRVRVAAPVDAVGEVLRRAGVVAALSVVPAVLDEAMVAVSSSR
jgi:ABC-2 type transport system ATP-binding protein/ribosome-dependent ATPase